MTDLFDEAQSFWIKRGDTLPNFAATLTRLDTSNRLQPVAIDGSVVRFHLRTRGAAGVVVIDRIATNLDTGSVATRGQVQYSWQVGDTAVPGKYEAEWEIQTVDGHVMTLPNPGFIEVTIGDDVI